MVTIDRLPFEEAINEPLLLKKAWEHLSSPQRTALKVFYGLSLNEEELKHWALFQGHALFDDLGFVKSIDPHPYKAVEYDEAWAIWGRRSAKTSGFLAFILVYEALLGGHSQYASPKQEVCSFFVAQKLDVAQAALRDFVEPLISSSKLLEKEIVKNNSEGIRLKSGHRIAPAPPVIKNFRYFAIPVVALDEVAFFYKDAESANPDFEVIRAVSPAQGQFPYHKLIGASTTWTKEGVIWEAHNAGTDGCRLAQDDDRKAKFKDVLVLEAPTPAMENPFYSNRKWFERQQRKDPEAYKRETLVQFTDAISGMFQESKLREAIKDAPREREPILNKGFFYIATIDPAFRSDTFAFSIGHYERERGFVQDLLRGWNPRLTKIKPNVILDDIKATIKAYEIDVVYSDQYQLESLQQLAMDRGFNIIGIDFTASSKAKIYGSFLQLLRNDRVKLLRNNEQFQQFLWMQKTVGHGGYVRISAPSNKHDDLVTVTVLGCSMAIRFEPERDYQSNEHKEKTPFEQIMASLNKPQNPDEDYL